jgi:hypothetical protein
MDVARGEPRVPQKQRAGARACFSNESKNSCDRRTARPLRVPCTLELTQNSLHRTCSVQQVSQNGYALSGTPQEQTRHPAESAPC